MSQTHSSKNTQNDAAEAVETEAKDLRDADLDQDVDDLLDEIDDVLEENAQEFIDAFIQKGGE